MKKIAVINDISGFGKCSLAVSLPIISALGIECNPIPTAILSNQTGYDDFYSVDFTENMTPYIDVWKKQNVHFDAILTGYLASEKQVDVILDFIEHFKGENTLVFVDPIMADDGVLYDTYDKKLCEKVKMLTKKADIIAPINERKGLNNINAQITPNTLNSVCDIAALFAEVFPTQAAMLAVIVVPIFSPRTIAQAISNGIQPILNIMSVIAIVADDDCRIRVSTVPKHKKISTEPKP